jgi:hypothetical protein
MPRTVQEGIRGPERDAELEPELKPFIIILTQLHPCAVEEIGVLGSGETQGLKPPRSPFCDRLQADVKDLRLAIPRVQGISA